MYIINVFSCENSGVSPVIFIHELKNKNSGVRCQEHSIPVKFSGLLKLLDLFLFEEYNNFFSLQAFTITMDNKFDMVYQ